MRASTFTYIFLSRLNYFAKSFPSLSGFVTKPDAVTILHGATLFMMDCKWADYVRRTTNGLSGDRILASVIRDPARRTEDLRSGTKRMRKAEDRMLWLSLGRPMSNSRL